MAMVAKVAHSDSLASGWIYHLFNSALIGAIFGWLLGRRSQRIVPALGWSASYGFVWWILGALILMPLFLGMPAIAPVMMAPIRPVAMGSLTGNLIYGIMLGGGFALLTQGLTGRTRHA